MFTVRNKSDLEFAYLLLNEINKMVGDEYTASKKDRVTEIKRAIRQFYKKQEDSRSRRIIKDYGIDGFIELYELPEVEDPQAYFDEYEWIHAKPSMYDCTGQAFTAWRKVFKRHGKNMVYHSVGFDV